MIFYVKVINVRFAHAPYVYRPGSWGPQHKVDQIANWDYPA